MTSTGNGFWKPNEYGQAGLLQGQSSTDEGSHGELRDGREGR